MKILKLGKPKKIGFYQAQSFLNCKFSIFTNSIEVDQKLKNPGRNIQAVLGIIFHSLIEQLASVEDPLDRLILGKKYIEEQSIKLRAESEFWWLEHLFSYSQASTILNRVANYKVTQQGYQNYRSFFEYEMLTKDELFYGRADRVLISDTQTIINEYKSANLHNQESFIEKHKAQIEYYAGVVLDNEPTKKVEGQIFSVDLAPIKIEIDEQKVVQQLTALREQVEITVNSKDSFESMQTPSAEFCLGCKLKPICRGFLSNLGSFKDFDGFVAVGELVEKKAQNATFSTLILSNEGSSLQITISNFHPFYKMSTIGKRYILSDLRRIGEKIDFSHRTIFYEE